MCVFCYLLSCLVRLPELFLDGQHCNEGSLAVVSLRLYHLIYLYYLGKLAHTELCAVTSDELWVIGSCLVENLPAQTCIMEGTCALVAWPV